MIPDFKKMEAEFFALVELKKAYDLSDDEIARLETVQDRLLELGAVEGKMEGDNA